MATFVFCLLAFGLVTLLVGVHIIGLIAFNPALRELDARHYVLFKQSLNRTAPKLAKPLMLACLASTLAALILASITGSWIVAGVTTLGFGALVMTLVAILRGDLPINRAMAGWSLDQPPNNWQDLRTSWEHFFVLRTATSAFAMLGLGIGVFFSAIGLA